MELGLVGCGFDYNRIGIGKYIACGNRSDYILKNDGSVWSCGYNEYGQLGIGKTGGGSYSRSQVNNNARQIACGYQHTVILKKDGSVWTCGYNNYGQLGLNDYNLRNTFTQVTNNINNDVKQIACGYDFAFILKNDGSVLGAGYSYNGFPQNGNSTSSLTFSYITSL